MSYEGYTQYLCKNGHYWTIRDEGRFGPIKEELTCRYCNTFAIWENCVDETNGSFNIDDNENFTDERIDGYIELELAKPDVFCTCQCGNKHIKDTSVYKIPENKGKIIDANIILKDIKCAIESEISESDDFSILNGD